MKRYNIIFTRDSRIFLSSVKYRDWREIQDSNENYMASLDFETLDEIIEYLMIEYQLTSDISGELVKAINGLSNLTVELNF
jgi:hypothetical protein